jgi:hypothetical protein
LFCGDRLANAQTKLSSRPAHVSRSALAAPRLAALHSNLAAGGFPEPRSCIKRFRVRRKVTNVTRGSSRFTRGRIARSYGGIHRRSSNSFHGMHVAPASLLGPHSTRPTERAVHRRPPGRPPSLLISGSDRVTGDQVVARWGNEPAARTPRDRVPS